MARYDRVLARQGEVKAIEERIARRGAELNEWEVQQVEDAELARALMDFDSIWRSLATVERTRFVNQLIEKVTYNGPTNKITVSFRTAELRGLCAGDPKGDLVPSITAEWEISREGDGAAAGACYLFWEDQRHHWDKLKEIHHLG